jgi:hypothetical protein
VSHRNWLSLLPDHTSFDSLTVGRRDGIFEASLVVFPSTKQLSINSMSDLASQLAQLTPEQRQAIMMKAQQEANQQVMAEMMQKMASSCFEKCAGTSVSLCAGKKSGVTNMALPFWRISRSQRSCL